MEFMIEIFQQHRDHPLDPLKAGVVSEQLCGAVPVVAQPHIQRGVHAQRFIDVRRQLGAGLSGLPVFAGKPHIPQRSADESVLITYDHYTRLTQRQYLVFNLVHVRLLFKPLVSVVVIVRLNKHDNDADATEQTREQQACKVEVAHTVS
jgi:hypothetical protein